MTVAQVSPVTTAYLDALRAVGRPIGDGRKPDGQAHLYPYGVLYVGTTDLRGDLLNPKEDGFHRLQVTTVGLTRESVEALRDDLRSVLHDRTVDIDGHAVVWTEHAGGQEVNRDDDVTPAVFYGVDVANVYVTPIDGS